MKQRIAMLAAIATIAALLAGCGGGGGGGTPPGPTTGTLTGLVLNSTTNAPIAGATVSVGARTATTSSSGSFTLSNVPTGSATIAAQLSGFQNFSRSISVAGGTQTVPGGNILLVAASTSFKLSGTVIELVSSAPVSGVVVTMSGRQTVTDSQGKFQLVLSSPPAVQTYSLNMTNSSPACYSFWAKANGVTQNPAHIAMPVAPSTGINVGTINLMSTDNPPPFPPP